MAFQMMQNNAAAQQAHYLHSLIGRNVKINRGGPDALTGRLLAVRSNYLVLQTRNGIVYINAEHVKSITEAAGGTGGRTAMYIMADSFNGVLRQLRQQFVQINQGGPEKVEGFIAEVSHDTLLLVSNKEAIRIPLFHIRSVSLAQQKGNKSSGSNRSGGNNNGGNNNAGNNNGGNNANNRSGGNRQSGGNRSQGGRTGGNRAGGAQGGNAVAQARAIRKSAAGSRRRGR